MRSFSIFIQVFFVDGDPHILSCEDRSDKEKTERCFLVLIRSDKVKKKNNCFRCSVDLFHVLLKGRLSVCCDGKGSPQVLQRIREEDVSKSECQKGHPTPGQGERYRV